MTGFVSFHGGLKTPEGQNYSETTGSILILHGSVDPVSGMDDVTNLVKELNDFEIQHEVHIYGGIRHSFTIKGSRDYSEKAEKKSWDALQSYLTKIQNYKYISHSFINLRKCQILNLIMKIKRS